MKIRDYHVRNATDEELAEMLLACILPSMRERVERRLAKSARRSA